MVHSEEELFFYSMGESQIIFLNAYFSEALRVSIIWYLACLAEDRSQRTVATFVRCHVEIVLTPCGL